MTVREKDQHPVRIYSDDWEKLKVKTKSDGISFQKLTEVLFKAYLKKNKEIMRLVDKFVEDKGTRKNRMGLDEIEADEILRMIEEEYSPLRTIEEVKRELENE